MGRTPCCDKNGLKKGPWTLEEDQKLTNHIQLHGPGNWRTLPKNAGLQRCGKSCRLRWTNYLRPDIKRGRFSFEEEETIIQLHSILGNKWSAIAARLPGRTDNEIKNYWNTHIRKRLLRNGIDPVTHAPRLDLLDLSSLVNSALCNQSLLNLSSLLGTQALLNPELLRLASTLQTLKQENPEMVLQQMQENQLYSSILQNPLINNYNNNNVQTLQNPSQEIPTSSTCVSTPPFSGQTQGLLVPSNTTNIISSSCQENIHMPPNLVVSQPEFLYGSGNNATGGAISLHRHHHQVVNHHDENSMFGSLKYSDVGVDSVLSTPMSSPDPLNSSSTFVHSGSTTEADERESYCSSLFKFEIPESLDIEDFM